MTTLGERFVRALAIKDFGQVAEQQFCYSTTGDQISWMRVLCSGFRPALPG